MHKTDPPIKAALHEHLEKHSFGSTLDVGAGARLAGHLGQHSTSP